MYTCIYIYLYVHKCLIVLNRNGVFNLKWTINPFSKNKAKQDFLVFVLQKSEVEVRV